MVPKRSLFKMILGSIPFSNTQIANSRCSFAILDDWVGKSDMFHAGGFFGGLQKGGDGNTLLNIGVLSFVSPGSWMIILNNHKDEWHDMQSLGVGGGTTQAIQMRNTKWSRPRHFSLYDGGRNVFERKFGKFDIFWGWWVQYHTKNIHQSPSFFHTAANPMTVDCRSSSHLRDAQSVIFRLVVFLEPRRCLTWKKRTISHQIFIGFIRCRAVASHHLEFFIDMFGFTFRGSCLLI